MSQYIVKIGDQEIALNSSDLSLDLVQSSPSRLHILKDQTSYVVEILESDYESKKLTLAVNGTKYLLTIEDSYDQLISQMGLTVVASQKLKEVVAPMPGLILEILVEEGQPIEKGSPLIVLEAMKMENILKAEGEGVIQSIVVQKGTAVDKGQILIVME